MIKMKGCGLEMSTVIHLFDIKAGMIVADDIWVEEKLLLATGTVIKPSYIARLHTYGVSKVTVYKQEVSDNGISENPIERFYEHTYRNVENILDCIGRDEKISASQIIPIIETILEVVFKDQDNILLLTGYRSIFDTYYYVHSMDVCIYSLITARAMGLGYDEILTLGIGALLHDIGKSKVPEYILNKKGSLTENEFEEVKKHSREGHNLLKNISQINNDVRRIVLEHHERCDGSGYPNNLRDNQIDKLSKIVAVADIYDALTSDRVYKKKVLPHEAAEYLAAISRTQLDWEITKIFLENIAIYPKDCQVLLNTNEIGVVISSNHQVPLRPKLKILTDKERNPLEIPYEIDLSLKLSIFITHIFN